MYATVCNSKNEPGKCDIIDLKKIYFCKAYVQKNNTINYVLASITLLSDAPARLRSSSRATTMQGIPLRRVLYNCQPSDLGDQSLPPRVEQDSFFLLCPETRNEVEGFSRIFASHVSVAWNVWKS